MKTTTLKYPSADGKTAIRALLWEPDAAEQPEGSEPSEGLRYSDVRGIVQVVHGMSEHVVRYAHFAKFLVESGFVVCANDHVGHGESVSDAQEDLGHMPARDGAEVLVRDVHALRGIMQARFGSEVPYVMFGHSMGSFIARKYISEHGEGLAAAVLCGTGQQAAALSMAGNAWPMRSRVCAENATKAGSCIPWPTAPIRRPSKTRVDFDWLSTDPAQVDAYINDSECGQMFTVGGYATLTALTGEVVRAESASKVPKVLPLLFIAGGGDPVGDCGRGVRKAAEEYRNAGVQSVETKIYAGMRHEILNEPGRARVMADVEAWLAKQGI